MSKGYVYVLYNSMFDKYGECYKVGYTKDIEKKIRYYNINYPDKCEIKFCTTPFKNYSHVGDMIHKMLNDKCVDREKEIFKCRLDDIINLIDKICGDEHIENNSAYYYCEFCKSKFSLKKTLDLHMKIDKECLKERSKNNINIDTINYKDLLHAYKSLEKEIKEKNEIHNRQIEDKNKQIQELQKKLSYNEIYRSIDNRSYNNTILYCDKPLLINESIIYEKMINTFRHDKDINGEKLAVWFVNNVCTNEKGKICIQCTDMKRKVFKYLDKDDCLHILTRDDMLSLMNACKNKIENETDIKIKADVKFINKLANMTYIKRK